MVRPGHHRARLSTYAAPVNVPCPGPATVFLVLVVATDGTTLDPVLSRLSPDVAPDCAEALIDWAEQLRWRPAHRLDSPVPMFLSLPVSFE